MKVRVETSAVAISNHSFLSTFIDADKEDKEYFEDRYGKISAAPVMMKRAGANRIGKRGFTRKNF
jgi:hypothetical protein